jgi:hypothetical protein
VGGSAITFAKRSSISVSEVDIQAQQVALRASSAARRPTHGEPPSDGLVYRVIVASNLGQEVARAVGAGEASRPLFGVIVPADRSAGAQAERQSVEVYYLGFTAVDLGHFSAVLGECGHTLRSADLAAGSPELDMHHHSQ